jgi:L-lactate dehydrogenase complex protein LldG
VTEKEKILGRIKEALSVQPVRAAPAHAIPGISSVPVANAARQWLPHVGAGFEDRLALFSRNALDLKADFHLLRTRNDLAPLLVKMRDAEGWTKIGTHSGGLTDLAARALGLPICLTDHPYAVNELENCDAGITECDALIAQTGSVLVTSRSAGGRALSVLPPHHVVLARKDQLIADLPEAFDRLKTKYASNYPSFISLITGPSRTGDIERILVLGAHGPKRLTIVCIHEAT